MATEVTTNVTGAGASSLPPPVTPVVSTDTVPPIVIDPPVLEETPKEDPNFAKRFAALARRERQLNERANAMKPQIDRLEQFQRLEQLAKDKPLALLDHFGLNYRTLTESVLNDEKPTTEQKIANLQKRIDSEKADRQRESEEAGTRALQATYDSFRRGVIAHIDSSGDAYELIRANDAHDTVMETIQAYWDQNQKLLPIEEAAKAVENHLEERVRKQMTLNRFKPKADPVSEIVAVKEEVKPVTLTQSATTGAPPPISGRLLSREESLARAAKLLKWTK